ncbi:MAG: cytochrome c biogenesis protein CcsA [Dechloromonas sp.]|nr:cytochrome c biogenesis protein CcsA [Dechloromonas sp.]MBN8555669.1 cytochrome c biogenesis protein CcsA [Deltaproteobacteria bacterium]
MNRSWILFWLAAVSMLGALSYVLLWLPPEAQQGFVQKIFFFHVPAAFAMYICLIVGAIYSCLYLYEKKLNYDQWARATLYVATIFATVVIVSGPIWAKPIWGVYWTWDPRLTTAFIVFILLLAYCFVRALFHDREGLSRRTSIIGAIIAVLAVLDIPLIHFSVQLWRGIHPSVLRNPEGLPDSFRTGLEVMMLAVFLLAAHLVDLILRTIKLQDRQEKKLNG